MTLGQLRAFLAVARHGSVNRAALELVVTQPAVSASVAALER
ncbi:MAG TPA: LysR family transcriptional regulator, partial [Actinomycetes bacterium]|nr:LysR family transcriptional regulator [Actinomycetes bacterium]